MGLGSPHQGWRLGCKKPFPSPASLPLLLAGGSSLLKAGRAPGSTVLPASLSWPLRFPSPAQQRAARAGERGDSAKEDAGSEAGTPSAQLDGVSFPSSKSKSKRQQGSGVPLARGGSGARNATAKRRVGCFFFFFSLFHYQKDQVRLAWHVTEWVESHFAPRGRNAIPSRQLQASEKPEFWPRDRLKTARPAP